MIKIIKNTTALDVNVVDVGVTILANSSYTIPSNDYALWAESSDVIIYISDGTFIINDGNIDLSVAQGVGLLQGSFIKKEISFDSNLVASNRLKIDVSGLSTDNLIEGSNLFFTVERAQDAVGETLTDTASIDLSYNDTLNTISATVIPSGVDHNSLANLTAGDPHTQYVKDAGTVTDNAIVRYDGTDGRTIQNSSVIVTDSGDLIAPGFVRVGDTSDTTPGNIKYVNTELLGRLNGSWKNLAIVPINITALADTATTSNVYSIINTMQTTPAAGTYWVMFSCTADLGNDTSGNIALFIDGTEQAITRRTLAINASGLTGAVADYEISFFTYGIFTVNGSQLISARFRENGGGTLNVSEQCLLLIPIER